MGRASYSRGVGGLPTPASWGWGEHFHQASGRGGNPTRSLSGSWIFKSNALCLGLFLYSTKDNNSTKRGALWRWILKVKVVGYQIPTSPVFTL